MSTRRYYSAVAVDNSIASNINSSTTSVTLTGAPVGYPSSYPFALALDYNTASEEIVLVTNVIGTTLTVSRANAGNGTGTCGNAIAHNAGAIVRHVITAQDMTDTADFIYTPTNAATSTPDVLMLFGG